MLREKPDRKEHVARDSGNGGRRPSWREADRWLLGLAWRSLADCKGAPRDFTPGLHVTQASVLAVTWVRACVRSRGGAQTACKSGSLTSAPRPTPAAFLPLGCVIQLVKGNCAELPPGKELLPAGHPGTHVRDAAPYAAPQLTPGQPPLHASP